MSKLVPAEAVVAAEKALEDGFDGGLLNTSEVEALLEAAAPIIAHRVLQHFAVDFQDLAEAIGVRPAVTSNITAIVMRYAQDIKEGKA